MSDAREMVCIACPIGCRLTVTPGTQTIVTGNRCPKGDAYGKEEVLSPRRVVTAVVRTDSARYPYISVRTDKPLPRGLITALLEELETKLVHLPAARGAALVRDFEGSGVDVVLTRTLPPIAPAQ